MRDRMIFNTNIKSIKKMDGMWNVSGDATSFAAPKVMVASGICSSPNIPTLLEKDRFGGPIVHIGGFGGTNVMENHNIKTY